MIRGLNDAGTRETVLQATGAAASAPRTRTLAHTRTHARDLCVCMASAYKVVWHALAVGQ